MKLVDVMMITGGYQKIRLYDDCTYCGDYHQLLFEGYCIDLSVHNYDLFVKLSNLEIVWINSSEDNELKIYLEFPVDNE